MYSTHLKCVTAVVVGSLLARPTLVEAPIEAAEMAGDPRSYTGAGGASCTHPLFVGLEYPAGDQPISVAIGDLDGVNGPDLAVANNTSDDVSVLLNQGDGTFAAALAYDAGNGSRSVAIGDLDGVNGPDLAVAINNIHTVSVLLNQGDGTFAAAVPYFSGSHPRSVAIGDLDGVNGPDLAVANPGRFGLPGDVSVLLAPRSSPWPNGAATTT